MTTRKQPVVQMRLSRFVILCLSLVAVGVVALSYGAAQYVSGAAQRSGDGGRPPVDMYRGAVAQAATVSPKVVKPMVPSTSMVRSPMASSTAPAKRPLHDPGPAVKLKPLAVGK